MQLYQFFVSDPSEVEALDLADSVVIEEEAGIQVISPLTEEQLQALRHFRPQPLPDLNWEEQWAAFAPNFQNGVAHIEVGGEEIRLLPGGGFGDFSDPTTQLMMQMMQKHLANRTIVDVGCGSGILSVAACKMGAAHVHALDISDEALQHTKKNAKLNGVEEKISTAHALSHAVDSPLILMNMISSEQMQAWEMNPTLHNISCEMITSGVLEEQRDDYLALVQEWGFTLAQEEILDGWAAFRLLCDHAGNGDKQS